MLLCVSNQNCNHIFAQRLEKVSFSPLQLPKYPSYCMLTGEGSGKCNLKKKSHLFNDNILFRSWSNYSRSKTGSIFGKMTSPEEIRLTEEGLLQVPSLRGYCGPLQALFGPTSAFEGGL